MSGGSFDYLCHKDVPELMGRLDAIQEMADALAFLGYAEDAAKETQELIQTLKQMNIRLEVMKDRLSGVWKAMEWWRSGDWGEDQFKESLQLYRGQ